VRLAVDPGTVRIGVARSDPHGVLATPLTVVRRGKGDLDALASLAATEEAMEILVGLPRSLSGREGHRRARQEARGGLWRPARRPRWPAHKRHRPTAHSAACGQTCVDRAADVDATLPVLLGAALRAATAAPGQLVDPGPSGERRLRPGRSSWQGHVCP
jgi:putative Holliday junction resolvase